LTKSTHTGTNAQLIKNFPKLVRFSGTSIYLYTNIQSSILYYILNELSYYDSNNRRNQTKFLIMANKDLFKQAIAEAKSIREAAIANAKEALEESLTPHLKDMLAAKLQEMEDSKVEEEVVNEVEEEIEEAQGNIDADGEGDHDQLEELEVEEGSMEDDEAMEEAEDDSEESEDEAEGDEEAEAEEEDEDIEVKDMEVDDLKNLIRDIIAQEMGDGGEEELDGADMDAGAEMEPAMDDMEAGAEDDEIDLDELLAELESATNEEIEEEVTEEVEEEVNEEVVTEEEVKEEDNSELTEALATIETLQNQLQEVNLLNAKLMYVNKVFKANNLSESQKVNIIAAFDKAETVKEVKLVFETVSENVVSKKATKVNESKLGMASKPTGTTAAKPEVISEVSDAVKRMQKLAGII
jgi:hypothetical protein